MGVLGLGMSMVGRLMGGFRGARREPPQFREAFFIVSVSEVAGCGLLNRVDLKGLTFHGLQTQKGTTVLRRVGIGRGNRVRITLHDCNYNDL